MSFFSRADKDASASHGVAASAISSVHKEFASEIMLRYEKRDAQLSAVASRCATRHEQHAECSRVRCTTVGAHAGQVYVHQQYAYVASR